MVVVFPVAYYSVYRFCRFNLDIKTITNDDWTKLVNSDIGKYKIIQYIRDKTPEDCLVLAFHQKDLNYYTKRKTVRHVDPRLFGFYKLDNKDKAYEFLLDLGIDYVYSPSYMLPTYFNSQIYRIVADPQLCELVMDEEGTRLFKLHKTRRDKNTTPINSENADFSFKGHNGSGLSGWQVYNDSEEYKASNWLLENDEDGRYVLTVRNKGRNKTCIYSFPGRLTHSPSTAFSKKSLMESATTAHFSAVVKGEGMLKVFLVHYPMLLEEDMWLPIWESILTKDYKRIENQFITPAEIREYRLVIILQGKGQLSLREVTLSKINSDYDVGIREQEKAETKSWKIYQRIELNEPAIYGWSPFSAGQSPWELTTESRDGKYAVYLSQPDKRERWYYTGKGSILKPPSHYSDNVLQVDGLGSSSFRISALVKGKGSFGLYVIWYDKNGRSDRIYLNRYFLQKDYKVLNKGVILPEEAREFRVAFRLSGINKLEVMSKKVIKIATLLCEILRIWETDKEPSILYIDDLGIEKMRTN